MKVPPFWTLVLVASVLLIASGCNSSTTPAEVSGTVLLDGKPLPEGQIIFESPDNSLTPAGAPIKDGKYTVKILPGVKKVKIHASRPTAKPDPVMGAAAKEEMIAPEFNFTTTLQHEVKSGKEDNVDFKVKALPRS